MRIFKGGQREKKPAVSTGIAAAIARSLEGLKRKLADFLGRQSERFTVPQKKTIFLLFGLVVGSMCAGLIIRPLTGDQHKRFTIPQTTKAPMLIQPSAFPDTVMAKRDYHSLIRFKTIMDSLKHSPEGRRQYEQIVKDRPGLLDSVDFLLGIK